MSILWINFMLNMAYEFYASPEISAVVNAAYNAGDSPNTPEFRKEGWSPRAEDFELDEESLLREAQYPAKAWRPPSPADELHFDSMPLSELTAVRGFV